MARASLWVGLDVGAESTTVCATDDHGTVMFEQSIASEAAAIHGLLKCDKRRIRLMAIESGSFGIVLFRTLQKLGYPIAMFDARQASKFLHIRRNKTDKSDARGLADVARLGRDSVSQVCVKPPECQRLRSTLATRQRLVQLRMTVEGTLRSLFRLNGGSLPSSCSAAALRRNVSAELRRLRRSERVDLSADVEPLVSLSLAARSYVEALDKQLAKRAEDDPVCRRFLEIPGVGPLTALSFYCAIHDPHRFRRNSDVAAFLGLAPVVRQSGQSAATHRISKMGDKMARVYLTTAANHHLKCANSALVIWGDTLSTRLRRRGVQVAVARKLAITMVAMWKSGDSYDPHRGIPTPAQSAQTG